MNADRYDLIDRYLDGAANPTEATELLNSMAVDPTVVQDMELSVALRSLAKEENESMVPPAGLYDKIVSEGAAAGLFAPTGAAVSSSAGASAAATAVATTSSLPLIISAVSIITVGALASALFFFTPSGDVATTTPIPPVPPTTMATTATPDGARSGGSPGTPVASLALVADPKSEEERPVEVTSEEVASAELSITNTASDETTPSVAEELTPEDILDQDTPHSHFSNITTISPVEYVDPPSVDDSERVNNGITTADVTPSQKMNTDVEGYRTATLNINYSIRVYQRPVSSLSYDAQTNESSLGSFSGEFDVTLGESHSVGAGFHRDLFPVNVLNNDGSTTLEPFMIWAGAHYRFSPKTNWPLGLRPFAQLAVGGSSSGVAIQPALGLVLPVGSLDIGAGVDALGLAFQSKGVWGMEYSPALRIELGYRF